MQFDFVKLYEWMLSAREVDRLELQLVNRGEAFFHVSGAGHEGSAALAPHLVEADWLHCHYRDKALMIARGISPEMFLNSVLCREASHSRGRQMSAHMSDPALKVLSIVGPVGNSALHAVGVAAQVKNAPENPIVLCSLGDGTTQQGEVLEAIAEAVRNTLPVLFLIHDNRFAISTQTDGRTFYSLPGGTSESFYGMDVRHIDGRAPIACVDEFGAVVAEMRAQRGPAIIVFDVDRLASHTNADDQRVYRSDEEIRTAWERGDPLRIAREALLEQGTPEEDVARIEQEVRESVEAACEQARREPEPAPCTTAKKALAPELSNPAREYRGDTSEPRLTMLESIREVLRNRLAEDECVVLFGEDIEDPKGDVFGATRGLTDAFPGRVLNSPLTESTIVGVSVGRALAGARPVAFLQFADFLPLAYNQIATELGSMWWRTDGAWEAPVIVMIACGGYKPGLGPFHSQSLESIASHVPGVDVFMPSTAGDAAGLLNAAFDSGRPTLFFYPKNLLNDREQTTSADVGAQRVAIGKARTLRRGTDLTFVGWGNAIGLCVRAADEIEFAGYTSDIIDLRSLSPWDADAVVASAEKTGRLIVVHEDNHTCGFGAEVLATVSERAVRAVKTRRVARFDTYVPCHFGNQLAVLPSFQRVLETAAELLDLEVAWENPAPEEPDLFTVFAIGSSPADESVTVTELLTKSGASVQAGDLIANVEADKASAEVAAPVSGVVADILVEEGETVKVGVPLLRIRVAEGEIVRKAITQEQPGTPLLRKRKTRADRKPAAAAHTVRVRQSEVGLASMGARLGSHVVTSEELAERFPDMDLAGLVRRTGIENRHWLGEGETPLSLAVNAASQALEREQLALDEVDLIVCTTGTPMRMTPSMSCLILHELSKSNGAHEAEVYDINAACSGYLNALQCAYDYLQSRPRDKVLVVTTEALSTRLNPEDFGTAILFGDAATATIVYGAAHIDRAKAVYFRPTLSGKGDDGSGLSVPLSGHNGEFVQMDGGKIYSVAVRKMVSMLKQACTEAEVPVESLDLVVPHQANQRIIDAIRQRLKVSSDKVYSNIRDLGNTSSSTIPLCLNEILPKADPGRYIGLCAFGGGFTYGAGVLKTV